MNIRLHVFFSGRVQGVWFRSNTASKAEELGLTGWIRNLNDGRVEAIFDGEADKVENIMRWCRDGPGHARVKNVESIKESPQGELNDFSVRY